MGPSCFTMMSATSFLVLYTEQGKETRDVIRGAGVKGLQASHVGAVRVDCLLLGDACSGRAESVFPS